MKLVFEIELDVPEADTYAESVYKHNYDNDFIEDDDLAYQLCYDIIKELENNWDDIIPKQIPTKYLKLYNKTIKSLYDNEN